MPARRSPGKTVDGSADDARTFASLAVTTPVPFVGAEQAADATLVLAGMRGITLVSPISPTSRP